MVEENPMIDNYSKY